MTMMTSTGAMNAPLLAELAREGATMRRVLERVYGPSADESPF